MKRVKTGIPGMDEILHGGFPKRNVIFRTKNSNFTKYFSMWKGALDMSKLSTCVTTVAGVRVI